MKIKLDENLPLRLATLLKDLGHDVHTLHDELLLGHADTEVWEAILGAGGPECKPRRPQLKHLACLRAALLSVQPLQVTSR